MKIIRSLKTGLALVGLLLSLGAANVAHALSFSIELDTTAIANHATGPFYLDFQSIFGSGSDQTIKLSNFVLTGGGFVSGTEAAFGDVTGDVNTALLLAPGAGSFYNEFFQQFDAGVTGIKFNVDLTTNAAAGTPTSFAVSILDSLNLFAIPTNGFADTLVLFEIDGSNTRYATAVSTGDTAGVTAAVPDAGNSAGLVAAAVLGLGLVRRLRRNLASVCA